MINTVPAMMVSTLTELIECADDMVETLFTDLKSNNTDLEKKLKYQNQKNISHVFMIPEMVNTDPEIKKYTDFSTVGKTVLQILSHTDN